MIQTAITSKVVIQALETQIRQRGSERRVRDLKFWSNSERCSPFLRNTNTSQDSFTVTLLADMHIKSQEVPSNKGVPESQEPIGSKSFTWPVRENTMIENRP